MQKCPNCGHDLKGSGHYVPPGLGDEGMFACKQMCQECKDESSPSKGEQS